MGNFVILCNCQAKYPTIMIKQLHWKLVFFRTPTSRSYLIVHMLDYLIIFVYLSSLPVAHLNDAPRRRLVVTGDSARIQDETTENSAWIFKVLGV